METVKEQRQKESSNFDLQHFIPIYNFYQNEKVRFYQILQAEARRQRWSAYDNIIETCTPGFYGRFYLFILFTCSIITRSISFQCILMLSVTHCYHLSRGHTCRHIQPKRRRRSYVSETTWRASSHTCRTVGG